MTDQVQEGIVHSASDWPMSLTPPSDWLTAGECLLAGGVYCIIALSPGHSTRLRLIRDVWHYPHNVLYLTPATSQSEAGDDRV